MNTSNENAQTSEIILETTAGSIYRFAWDRMKKYFLDFFLITIILGFLLFPLMTVWTFDGSGSPGGVLLRMFAFAYWLLLWAPIHYGATFVFYKAVKGEKFEFKDIFLVFDNYLNVVLAHILVVGIVGIGVFLLIVPGIIFACRLAFVPYLVVEKKLEPAEAVKKSWKMTAGFTGTIFLLGLIAAPLVIAGLLCMGVGIIPAIIWVHCAFAAMYFAVSQLEEEKTAEAKEN
jgi:hypothetical protein